MRPWVRRSAAALNTAIARRRTRRVLVAAGVSARRSGIYLRISRAAVNLATLSTSSKVSSSLIDGSGRQPPKNTSNQKRSRPGCQAKMAMLPIITATAQWSATS